MLYGKVEIVLIFSGIFLFLLFLLAFFFFFLFLCQFFLPFFK